MALQGSIESFSVCDVLALLAGSQKTGRLVVNGDRGSASVWLEAGWLVGGQPSSGGAVESSVDEAVLDLLRFESGSFVFEADIACPAPAPPRPVFEVVDLAQAALDDLATLGELVPSTAAAVTMVAELAEESVSISRETWAVLAALGSEITVAEMGSRLGLDDVGAIRAAAHLVAAGLVHVGEPQAAFGRGDTPPEGNDAPIWDGSVWGMPVDPPLSAEPLMIGMAQLDGREQAVPDAGVDPDSGGGFDAVAEPQALTDPPVAPVIVAPRLEMDVPDGLDELFGDFDPFAAPTGPEDLPEGVFVGATDLDEQQDGHGSAGYDDLARQMAMLSPRAARAVAAASEGLDGVAADTSEEGGRDDVVRYLGSLG